MPPPWSPDIRPPETVRPEMLTVEDNSVLKTRNKVAAPGSLRTFNSAEPGPVIVMLVSHGNSLVRLVAWRRAGPRRPPGRGCGLRVGVATRPGAWRVRSPAPRWPRGQ